jgi:hypothetical protein
MCMYNVCVYVYIYIYIYMYIHARAPSRAGVFYNMKDGRFDIDCLLIQYTYEMCPAAVCILFKL